MLIVDGHCDTLYRCREAGQSLWKNSMHWDIERALAAGVGIQFMALYNDQENYPEALTVAMEQIALLKAAVDKGQVHLITRMQDLDDLQTIGVILHLEGGLALGHNSDLLPLFYHLGLRSLGLTWNHRNQLADGIGVDNPSGLTDLGRKIIKQVEKLGMIVDIAHLAAPGVEEILDNYSGTVVYTHGNYREVHDHRRNITTHQAKKLAERGGVIGLSLCPYFISTQPGIEDWLQHLCRLCSDIGCEYVALGSDFDGDDHMLFDDVGFYKMLPDLLSQAGFTSQEAEMITGGNWLRVLKRTLSLS
ncbi:MAG: dipeptidase [Methylocystaceae bacterium]